MAGEGLEARHDVRFQLGHVGIQVVVQEPGHSVEEDCRMSLVRHQDQARRLSPIADPLRLHQRVDGPRMRFDLAVPCGHLGVERGFAPISMTALAGADDPHG